MKTKVSAAYDPQADVLYLSLGEPTAAISEEIAGGVLIRRAPGTGQIVGLTIMDYKEWFVPQDLWHLTEHVEEELSEYLRDLRTKPGGVARLH